MLKTALVTAGVIFTLLAISHFIRWLYAVEVLVDGKTLPVVAYIFAGLKKKTNLAILGKGKTNEKKANLLFWILMFIGIALASFSLIIDHVRISINQ